MSESHAQTAIGRIVPKAWRDFLRSGRYASTRASVGADGSEVPVELTEREREVVVLIALGLETGGIAEELTISVDTVRTHVRNAMAKLGAHTRAQLVAVVMSQP